MRCVSRFAPAASANSTIASLPTDWTYSLCDDFPAVTGIESTFATVRHRTTRNRNCVSRPTFLGPAFKLIEEAEKSWRRIRGADQTDPLLNGLPFKDGLPMQGNQIVQQKSPLP